MMEWLTIMKVLAFIGAAFIVMVIGSLSLVGLMKLFELMDRVGKNKT